MRVLIIMLSAVAVLAVGLLLLLRHNAGERLRLEGAVLKVRTHPIEGGSSLAVLDFRITNASRHPFVVQSVDVILETEGELREGSFVSDVDATRVMQEYKALGQKYNPSLTVRQRVAPGETIDRMAMAMFEVPVSVLETRKGLRVKVIELDGNVSEIVEQTK